ncbi:unnamed protein product [Phytophthora fragariaefolia]|uniref:Unnamed protein product n=1 Tax=Phytophthora fragariaefolia TaxID=1490495 RepID=A0A9W6Y9D3_9STRA|nr:unnamed protein product [Phytophthora fragariaefolia]
MMVLIDSGASFNFATEASVARNNAFYASALEAFKGNTNVSVRLATGSIVSTRKVTIPLNVKFDDFDSVEPFIVLDMDDRYDLILGMSWLAKHGPRIDWCSRTIGPCHSPLADRAFVHSRASEGKTAVEAHLGHLREVLLCMRENHLYANIHKCIFGAEDIPFLGCFLGKDGVRADPEKVCAIAQLPVPVSQKDLRK